MSELNRLIDEAMATCARLNAQLSVIAAKVGEDKTAPEFRYFKDQGVIWKASKDKVISRGEHKAKWEMDSMLTLHDLTSTNTPEITAEEGEPS